MGTTELHANSDGYVLCPIRGEVSVEWCEGCPFRIDLDDHGGRVVVVCDPGPDALRDAWAGPLREDPPPWA